MHGRRRQEYKDRLKDPKLSANLSKKAQQWNTLVPQLLHSSHDISPQQALSLTEKLLLVNPDPLVLWNKRRTLFLFQENEINIQNELSLTASCLQRNPKAYGAWFHRKWILSNYNKDTKVLQQELQLTSLLLKQDERNFHGWNYRSFCVGLLLGSRDGSWPILDDKSSTTTTTKGPQVVISPCEETTTATTTTTTSTTTSLDKKKEYHQIIQAEWDFTTNKITDNFSNYSAIHHRSKLLNLMENIPITQELELVHNAMFTEPDDQTAWWYHRFLLVEHANDIDIQVLNEELELLQQLNQELEGQSKWTWLGLHVVLQELQTRGEHVEEKMASCLHHLLQLDPDRAARYTCMAAKQE